MSWFSKKQLCAHCGTNKTRRELEGQPTCTECRMNLLMSREVERHCPVDGKTLSKTVSGEVILDQCPECNGVWLDAGELDAIKKAANEEGMGAGMVFGMVTG